MPWFSIIMALLSFFTAKKSGASGTKALLAGAAVGLGSYYVTHETDWGRANLGSLDGVVASADTAKPLLDAAGNPIVDPATGTAIVTRTPVVAGGTTSSTGGSLMDVLSGAGGTAASVGIGAVAAATVGAYPWLIPALVLGGAYFLLKD